ncbi:MAG: DUF3078 domain-containing protein [Flavobacteriales bacterium]|nr:DUF3078 domain-containing protein [Flavobacteriales bacterium]
MIRKITVLLLLVASISSNAQDISKEDSLKTWRFVGENKLTFGTVALTNWSAGGADAASGLASIDYRLDYEDGGTVWSNRLILAYGVNAHGNEELVAIDKTDDRIDFTSAYGKRFSDSNYYLTALTNFKTQFSEGLSNVAYKDTVLNDNGDPYLDPDGNPYVDSKSHKIRSSTFMAPAYWTISPGAAYKTGDNFKLVFSPLSTKLTFVLDKDLADNGAFGVTPGKQMLFELGTSIDIYWKQLFTDSFFMENTMRLYSNYIVNYGNVDVDWTFRLNYKLHKFFSVDFNLHTLYDDDVKIDRIVDGVPKSGPMVQVKTVIGIGFIYTINGVPTNVVEME